ncbi:MAG: hypothetical protein ACRCWB_04340 [Enterovibrio sp.]
MSDFILILCSVAVMLAMIMFFLGMIKPSLIRAKSRPHAALLSFGLFITSFIVLALLLPSEPQTEQNAAAVVAQEEKVSAKTPEFSIIEKTDLSTANRKRINVLIVSPGAGAKTKAERADVVMHVAKLIQKETDADVIRVALEPSVKVANRGGVFAYVIHTPDGCGHSGRTCDGKIWDLNSSETQVSDYEMSMWEAWVDHRDKFIEDGLLNEEKLQEFLAVQFKTDPEQITIPLIWREPVPVDI